MGVDDSKKIRPSLRQELAFEIKKACFELGGGNRIGFLPGPNQYTTGHQASDDNGGQQFMPGSRAPDY